METPDFGEFIRAMSQISKLLSQKLLEQIGGFVCQPKDRNRKAKSLWEVQRLLSGPLLVTVNSS